MKVRPGDSFYCDGDIFVIESIDANNFPVWYWLSNPNDKKHSNRVLNEWNWHEYTPTKRKTFNDQLLEILETGT